MEYQEALAPMWRTPPPLLHNAPSGGQDHPVGGQLGSLKDPDLGIYPMVTSSSPLAGYWRSGRRRHSALRHPGDRHRGKGLFQRGGRRGVCQRDLRRRGGRAAPPGRRRRQNTAPPPDAPPHGLAGPGGARYGCMVQGATAVAFTVLDALGYLDEIPFAWATSWTASGSTASRPRPS